MDIKKFRRYYLDNDQNARDFKRAYKDKIVHFLKDYEKIVKELFEQGFLEYDTETKTYFIKCDESYDYALYGLDSSEKSFIMDMCETGSPFVVFKKGIIDCVPLYCIQEAWDYMEEEVTTIDKSETVTSDKYENLILKILNNPKVVEDVNQLKQSANLTDEDVIKILEVCLK